MPETSTRRFEIGVAGVTFEGRQDILERLWITQFYGVGLAATLQREPDNPHDPNAIQVAVTTAETNHPDPIGFVPRALAAKLAPIMDAGAAARVTAVRILRGGDPAVYGARIDVEIEQEAKA